MVLRPHLRAHHALDHTQRDQDEGHDHQAVHQGQVRHLREAAGDRELIGHDRQECSRSDSRAVYQGLVGHPENGPRESHDQGEREPELRRNNRVLPL